jgi:chemotaxis protein CheZ
MSATDWTHSLAQRVEALRHEHGESVGLDEVVGVVESLMETMEGDIAGVQVRVSSELHGLIEYIQQAKTEIAALSPEEIHDEHIPVATDELDEVVKATEEATGAILDAAEELESLAGELSGEAAEKITDITTKIYEASNFQDITGQRITKVVNTLKHIEAKVRVLSEACGYELRRDFAGDEATPPNSDQDLLNGPQLPANANNQDDIDALLASFD